MQLEVLGTNAAFAKEGTTNSFILWKYENDGILLDCGFSVYQELLKKNYADKINTVLISHLHQDHSGSLVNLLDYRFKILNRTTSVGGTPTDKFLQLHSGTGWEAKIHTFPENVSYTKFEVPHAKGMECYALFVEDKLLYSGDSASSVLSRPEAQAAKMIIHDVSLGKGGIIISVDELADATPEVKAKTFLSHYLPKDYDLLAAKAQALGFAGVLKAGDKFEL